MPDEKRNMAPSTAAFIKSQEALKKDTYGVHPDLERQFHTAPGDLGRYWYYGGVNIVGKAFIDGPYSTKAEAEIAAQEVPDLHIYDVYDLPTRDIHRATSTIKAIWLHKGLQDTKMDSSTALKRARHLKGGEE